MSAWRSPAAVTAAAAAAAMAFAAVPARALVKAGDVPAMVEMVERLGGTCDPPLIPQTVSCSYGFIDSAGNGREMSLAMLPMQEQVSWNVMILDYEAEDAKLRDAFRQFATELQLGTGLLIDQFKSAQATMTFCIANSQVYKPPKSVKLQPFEDFVCLADREVKGAKIQKKRPDLDSEVDRFSVSYARDKVLSITFRTKSAK